MMATDEAERVGTRALQRGVRWVASRKLALLQDIDAGRITEATAMRRYSLSQEELDAWRRDAATGRSAVDGLKLKHLQERRR